MKGEWRACVQKNETSQLNCKQHQVPAKIEVDFPDFDGYILYRKQFTLSKEISKQALGIYIATVRDSDELYINGQLVAKTGAFKPNFSKATIYSRYYIIPSHVLKSDQTNNFELKVFNHARYGGMSSSAPIIDTANNTVAILLNRNSLVVFYMGIFFIIFVIQLFYYLAQKNHREHLYFSLFSIFSAAHLYTFSDLPVYSKSNLNLLFELNLFIFVILTILFCLFINTFFHRKLNTLLKVTIATLALSAIIQITILPQDLLYHQLYFINLVTLFILLPYYMWLFFTSIKQKIRYAKTMALVSSLHIFGALTDILTDMRILPEFFSGVAGLISPITLMILFLTISLILTHRHWKYYRHATYDFLTGALRRSAFIERLTEEIPRSQRLKEPLLVALLDIDDFKKINDQHTHSAGDKVLKEIVKRAREQLRDFDLLSRYGGDEFCIAASVDDSKDAIHLLKRVQKGISEKPLIVAKGVSVNVSVTIGAYVAEPNAENHPEALIAEADKILIQGKVNQKGKIHI